LINQSPFVTEISLELIRLNEHLRALDISNKALSFSQVEEKFFLQASKEIREKYLK